MVLPLALNPTAPGQGALALEIRRDRSDLVALLATDNDEASYPREITERPRLAPTADEDNPHRLSILPLPSHEIEFTRGQRACQHRLRRQVKRLVRFAGRHRQRRVQHLRCFAETSRRDHPKRIHRQSLRDVRQRPAE